MLFRGYITQFARRFTANPYLFIGAPAALFALPHIVNIVALGGTIFVAIPYLIAGLLYSWTAYKTGSLWMSLGLHLSNNFANLVLDGTVGDILPSAAPFQVQVPSLAITIWRWLFFLPLLGALLVGLMVVRAVALWSGHHRSFAGRIYYTLLLLAGLVGLGSMSALGVLGLTFG